MGRSVSYLSYAEYVIYFTADWINGEIDENGEQDCDLCSMNWQDFMTNLTCEIQHKLKSYYDVEEWDGNETHIFLKNQLAEIGISEYGIYSLSIRARDDEFYGYRDNWKEGLAKNHCNQVRKTLEKCLVNSGGTLLNKIGTFSNDESVYRKV